MLVLITSEYLGSAYSFPILPEPVAFRLDWREGLGGVRSTSGIRHVRKVNSMTGNLEKREQWYLTACLCSGRKPGHRFLFKMLPPNTRSFHDVCVDLGSGNKREG